jgi:hypothetical protein
MYKEKLIRWHAACYKNFKLPWACYQVLEHINEVAIKMLNYQVLEHI